MKRKYNEVVASKTNKNYLVLKGQKIENGVLIRFNNFAEGDDPTGWEVAHYYRKYGVVKSILGIKSEKEARHIAKIILLTWDYNLKPVKRTFLGKGNTRRIITEYINPNNNNKTSTIQKINKTADFKDMYSGQILSV